MSHFLYIYNTLGSYLSQKYFNKPLQAGDNLEAFSPYMV